MHVFIQCPDTFVRLHKCWPILSMITCELVVVHVFSINHFLVIANWTVWGCMKYRINRVCSYHILVLSVAVSIFSVTALFYAKHSTYSFTSVTPHGLQHIFVSYYSFSTPFCSNTLLWLPFLKVFDRCNHCQSFLWDQLEQICAGSVPWRVWSSKKGSPRYLLTWGSS